MELLLLGVATQLDDLHSVEQSRVIVPSWLAVAMNRTFDRSTGTSR